MNILIRCYCVFIFLMPGFLGCDDKFEVDKCTPGKGHTFNNDAPCLGDTDAPVKVTMFGDLTCAYTVQMMITLSDFKRNRAADCRPSDLQVVYRHLPRGQVGRQAATAIAAAYIQDPTSCWGDPDIGQSGMLWCLSLLSFDGDDATVLDEQSIRNCAAKAGLDVDRFDVDVASDQASQMVADDEAMALEIGMDGTPAMVLCGKHISPNPQSLISNLEHLICSGD